MTVRAHGLPQVQNEHWTKNNNNKKRRKQEFCLSGASLSMEMMTTCPIFKFPKSKNEKDVFWYFYYFYTLYFLFLLLFNSVSLDSGSTCKSFIEKFMSKIFHGRLLNSHSTVFPRKKKWSFSCHTLKKQIITDNIFKKW